MFARVRLSHLILIAILPGSNQGIDMDMALDVIVSESLPWRHIDEGPEWADFPFCAPGDFSESPLLVIRRLSSLESTKFRRDYHTLGFHTPRRL